MPKDDDLVRRRDAYKTLKAIASIMDRFCEAVRDCSDTFNDFAPSVDAVEVIRCGDCDYFKNSVCDRWADGTLMCPDDYCSRALRAEEES